MTGAQYPVPRRLNSLRHTTAPEFCTPWLTSTVQQQGPTAATARLLFASLNASWLTFAGGGSQIRRNRLDELFPRPAKLYLNPGDQNTALARPKS